MPENQEKVTRNQERQRTAVLTHIQFFKACEALKKNKQAFLDARPTLAVAAQMLTELVRFPVSFASVRDIQEAADIHWEMRHLGRGKANDSSIKSNAIRSLTVCLYRLLKKLGEEVPESIQQLYDSYQKPPVEYEMTPPTPTNGVPNQPPPPVTRLPDGFRKPIK